MKRIQLLTLVLCLWPLANASAEINIIPLGDSITQGRNAPEQTPYLDSWRREFWFNLLAGGYTDIDMVGTLDVAFGGSAPLNTDYDYDHEARWGWALSLYIQPANVPTWLATLVAQGDTPDIALVHLGSNDDDDPGLTILNNMDTLVGQLRSVNPNVVILIAEPGAYWGTIDDFADLLPQYAIDNSTVDSPIVSVDLHTGWIADPATAGTHTCDWVHPNTLGEEWIADKFYDAVLPYLDLQVEVAITAHPAGVSVTEDATATFSVTATGDAPLSYQWQIDTGSGWGDIGGANASSYTTPATTLADDGNQYRCVVSNTIPSSATSTAATLTVLPYTVTVTAPAGGQSFKGKQDVTVTWTSTLPGDVKIEFTDDNWSTSTTVVASTANDGSHVWELPNVTSANCAFRVSDLDDDPSDDSGTFSIAQITDTDDDRMDDGWETTFWVDITESNGTGDEDGDGLTDLEEFWLGRDPTVKEQTSTRSSGCVPGASAGAAMALALGASLFLRRRSRR